MIRFPFHGFGTRFEEARPGTRSLGEQLDRNFAEIERWANGYLAQDDVSTTTYTLEIKDMGKVLRFTNASAVTVTVPPVTQTADFPVGGTVAIYAAGAGGVTISAGSGVTIRNNAAPLLQYEEVRLRQDSKNVWVRS